MSPKTISPPLEEDIFPLPGNAKIFFSRTLFDFIFAKLFAFILRYSCKERRHVVILGGHPRIPVSERFSLMARDKSSKKWSLCCNLQVRSVLSKICHCGATYR
jgi:hypothetical protein